MDNTTIADTLIRLSNKLDALYDSLPQRYVPRSEFEPWRIVTENRVKSLEDNLTSLKESLHTKTEERMILGMQTLKNIEDKIEQRHNAVLIRIEDSERTIKQSNDNSFNKKVVIISLIFAGIGSSIGIFDFILTHIHF